MKLGTTFVGVELMVGKRAKNMAIKSVRKLRDITWGVLGACIYLHSHHARDFATKEIIVAEDCFIVRRICYNAA